MASAYATALGYLNDGLLPTITHEVINGEPYVHVVAWDPEEFPARFDLDEDSDVRVNLLIALIDIAPNPEYPT